MSYPEAQLGEHELEQLTGCDARIHTRTDQFGRRYYRRCGEQRVITKVFGTTPPLTATRCVPHSSREWLQQEGYRYE